MPLGILGGIFSSGAGQLATLEAPACWSACGNQSSQLALVPPGGLTGGGGQRQVVRGVQANPELRAEPGTREPICAGGMRGTASCSPTATGRAGGDGPLVMLARPGVAA